MNTEQLVQQVEKLSRMVRVLTSRMEDPQDVAAQPLRWFKTLEEWTADAVWVSWVERTDDTQRGIYRVYQWDDIVSLAPAGYKGVCGWIQREWIFLQGPCVEPCLTEGTLGGSGRETEGTVGEAFEYCLGSDDLTDGPDYSNLPPGLTGTDDCITGTPTEAGTWYVVVTGQADETGGGTCDLSAVVKIVINEPEEEEE